MNGGQRSIRKKKVLLLCGLAVVGSLNLFMDLPSNLQSFSKNFQGLTA